MEPFEARKVTIERIIQGEYREVTRYAVFQGDRQMLPDLYTKKADAQARANKSNEWYGDLIIYPPTGGLANV